MTIKRMYLTSICLLFFGAALIIGVSAVSGQNFLLTLMGSASDTRQLEIVDPDPDLGLPDVKWHFFDENKENAYTFGAECQHEDAEKARNTHAEWLAEDPANLAAAANYIDHELPVERILKDQTGELVGAQCDLGIDEMLRKPEYRKEVLDRVQEILADAKVEIRDIKTYGSWMYQQDLDGNNIPEVIIRDNPQNYVRSKGHELVYIITIEGKDYELHFRLECGFQPIMISWWTPPQTPPPPRTTTPPPHTTAPPPKETTTVTETTHGPFKNTDQVVTNAEGGNHNGYVDDKPDETVAEEDRYVPGKATTTTTVAATSDTPAASTKATSATTGAGSTATNVEDKILPSTTVTVRPEEVTVPASDYVAPKDPNLVDIPPANGEIEIPE